MNKHGVDSVKVDLELDKILSKRVKNPLKRLIVVGSGITSSHLGDERNIREFLMASYVSNKLRDQGTNVVFYLFDDSYDPLNFRQLRVAVNKDEKLIEKFKDYCGTPIKLIPDPYDCHSNYSQHFQNEILKRFHKLGIFPSIVDSYNSYESGLYDFAKKRIFENYKEITIYLKQNFPKYTMKKIFWVLCNQCNKIDQTDIKKIYNGKIYVYCNNCDIKFTEEQKTIRGKFSWKVDTAIRWNVFKVDFEPYSKAYLDPDLGSYFIAKKISDKFLGGYYPEIINYGQIIMGKSLSYKILSSFPKDAFHSFFTQNRKKDLELSEEKLIQFARDYKIDVNLSFYDYILSRLPYDLFDTLQGNKIDQKYASIMEHAISFSRNFLNKEPYPTFPKKEILNEINSTSLLKIKKTFRWVITYKLGNPNCSFEIFTKDFAEFVNINKINKKNLFPKIRHLLSQEHSLPMSKIFYYAPNTFLYGCLLEISQAIYKNKLNPKKDIHRNNLTISSTI